ncbi:MAG TPA: hypothetical protein VF941_00730 [Clostridia bacterium]
MSVSKIKNLRKMITASITDCKKALEESEGDVERAFYLLKLNRIEPIVRKTGVSHEEAFKQYEQWNGDTDKAIQSILYLRETSTGLETECLPSFYKRDKHKTRYTNQLFKCLTKEIGTKEYDTFMVLLRGLKDNSPLIDYYGCEFIEIITELLSRNNIPTGVDKYDRALLIETLIEALYENELFDKCDYFIKHLNEFFDEYTTLCSQLQYENVVRCLTGFIDHGISSVRVFARLAEKIECRKNAVAILARMGIAEWGEIPDEFSELLSEVKKASRIISRSHEISQFILITHQLCGNNSHISSISFSYFSYGGACSDWGWILPGSTKRLVESKILSKREALIFEKLGNLINSGENLNSNNIRVLYHAFFERKDPFDVIYALPE